MATPAGAGGGTMMVFGETAKYQAQRNAANRAEAERQRGQADVDARNQEILNSIVDGAQQYNATDRLASHDAMTEQKIQTLLAAMEGAGGDLGEAPQGKVSDDYLQARATRMADETRRATTIAKLLGKVQAPGMMKFDEGMADANTQSETNIKSSNRDSIWRAYLEDIKRAGQPDSHDMLLGSILSGGGTGLALGG